MKAVIYCRVSSDKQVREGNGLEGQENRCREYAKFHKIEVDKVFRDEGVSGGTLDRPGINSLLNYITKAGKSFYVIVDDMTRLARDVIAHFTLKKAIADAGSHFRCVNTTIEDSPEGEFFETLIAAQSQLSRKQNSRQVKSRMRARFDTGYWTFCPPGGFKYIDAPTGRGRILVVDEPKAAILKEALEGFASGRFQTQTDVANFLNEKRYCYKKKFVKITVKQVNRFLTQKLYAGLVFSETWDATAQGTHPAIISIECFEKIQERLNVKYNKKFSRKCDNEDFPIRGFALCPNCKKAYTASWSKGRNNRYPYYRCSTKGCTLPKKSIKREDLENFFSGTLKQVTPSKQIIELAKAISTDVYNQRIQRQDSIIAGYKKDIKVLEKQIQCAVDKLIATKVEAVQKGLEHKIESLEEEKRELEYSINQLNNKEINFGTALDAVMSFIGNPYVAWADGDLKKKQLVHRLVFVNPIVIHPSEPIGTANLSLPFKMLGDFSEKNCQVVEAAGIEPASLWFTPDHQKL
ncbi:TPA: hypothetical protein JBI62_00870 [Legionella pneumophila]|nr:hypothetical protein [Legionella pneumophila]